ncbi:MAG: hypothetical protein PHF63_00220 [Herbinix sp.]|nr:hypothetical protein [Herbinix sp.]
MDKNKKKKKNLREEAHNRALLQSRKDYKEKKRELKAAELSSRSTCRHKKDSGKPTIKMIEGTTKGCCKQCQMKFDLAVQHKDRIKSAKNTVYAMCEQIRMMCDPDNSKVLKDLTMLEVQFTDISKAYKALLKEKSRAEYSKKNKKKNRNNPLSAINRGYHA